MANPKDYRSRRQPVDTGDDDAGYRPETNEPADGFTTNARSERDYMKPGRLPTVDRFGALPDGDYGMIREDLSMHDRVSKQVLCSIGERAGTMTFASQLDRSRGVGTLGNTGGVQERGSGSKGEKPKDRGGNLAGGRY